MAAGYDDAEQRFLIRNSWGADWGKRGYFTMPYQYLGDRNLSDDFWTIRAAKERIIHAKRTETGTRTANVGPRIRTRSTEIEEKGGTANVGFTRGSGHVGPMRWGV
jgi:C1A family cysteine protease